MVGVALLAQILEYDAETGQLFWRARDPSTFAPDTPLRIVRNWNSRFAGGEAFTAVDAGGYRVGTISGRRYYAHRVALAISSGTWPEGEVDHVNGDRADNRLANLRRATSSENGRNAALSSRNTSGYVGVSWCARRAGWVAQMHLRTPEVHLHEGPFRCAAAAAVARKRMERRFNFHDNHGRAA